MLPCTLTNGHGEADETLQHDVATPRRQIGVERGSDALDGEGGDDDGGGAS